MINVNQMYKYMRDESKPLLSNYPADFWKEYRDNYSYFDRLFMKSFRSFIPFNSLDLDDVDEVSEDFAADCYNYLLANDKRYTELFRVQEIDDDDYNFMFNYDMTETYEGQTGQTGSETQGQRQDSRTLSTQYGATSQSSQKSESLGSHTDTKSSEFNYAAKTENLTKSETLGAHTDTHENTNVYGALEEDVTRSETLGAHTDTHSDDITYGATTDTKQYGAASDTVQTDVSAFNETLFQPKEKVSTTKGTHTDTESSVSHTDERDLSDTYGAQTNSVTETRDNASHTDHLTLTDTMAAQTNSGTEQRTEAARKDTASDSTVYGAQSNSGSETLTAQAHTDATTDSFTKGSQTNTTTGSGTSEHTLTRRGNIGIQTTSDIIEKHIGLWKSFSFYKIVFDDLANEFLRV